MEGFNRNFAKEVACQLAKLSTSKMVSTTGIAVMCGYDIKSSAVYELIKTPGFPKPVQLIEGGKKRWYREEVENWLDSRSERTKFSDFTAEERVQMLANLRRRGY